MLYILLFIFICFIIIAITYDSPIFGGIGMIGFTTVVICTAITLGDYNSIKSTSASKLEVLNEQNEIVLKQIEPLVQQALNYESNTYKEFKLTPENIVAFGSMYPQLQANSFIQSQINIIVENQKEIKDLKLKIASLNAYRIWLFTKKE